MDTHSQPQKILLGPYHDHQSSIVISLKMLGQGSSLSFWHHARLSFLQCCRHIMWFGPYQLTPRRSFNLLGAKFLVLFIMQSFYDSENELLTCWTLWSYAGNVDLTGVPVSISVSQKLHWSMCSAPNAVGTGLERTSPYQLPMRSWKTDSGHYGKTANITDWGWNRVSSILQPLRCL